MININTSDYINTNIYNYVPGATDDDNLIGTAGYTFSNFESIVTQTMDWVASTIILYPINCRYTTTAM